MPELKIAPSILAAHPGRLEEGCVLAERAGADALHLDNMDGHFVPNLSLGPAVVAMAREAVGLHLDVHLMLSRPDALLDAFLDAGADTLLIHAEARCDVAETLARIRSRGVRPGITVNPETPAEAAMEYGELVDEILCMTVHPGFGGQAFIPEVLPKIERIREALPEVDLSVDGGINDDTAADCAAAGANLFVAGVWLYRADDMGRAIDRLRGRVRAASPLTGAS